MESLAPAFLVIGTMLYVVAYLWSVVFVFRVNAFLGFICLLGPIVALIVIVRRWPESQRPAALWGISFLFLLAGVLLSPTIGS